MCHVGLGCVVNPTSGTQMVLNLHIVNFTASSLHHHCKYNGILRFMWGGLGGITDLGDYCIFM